MTRPAQTYRPSGRANWLLLLPGTAAAMALAVLAARWLSAAYFGGLYIIVFTPMAAALPVGAMMYLAVATSQCRNPRVAATLGLLVGGLLFFGHFYFSMIAVLGPRAGRDPANLARFIVWRISTDVDVWVLDQIPTKRPQEAVAPAERPSVAWRRGFNTLTYLMDLMIVIAAPGGMGRLRAIRAYCEDCRRWMRRRSARIPLDLASAIVDHLARGTLETVPEFPPERRRGQPHARLAVVYCSAHPEAFHCGAYLTVTYHGKEGSRVPWLKLARVTPREMAAVARVVPALRPLVENLIGIKLPGKPVEKPMASPSAIGVEAAPTVDPGSTRRGPRPLSLANWALRRGLCLAPLLGAVGGFAATMGALYIWLGSDMQPPHMVRLVPYLAIGGIAGFLLCGLWAATNIELLSNCLARRLATRAIGLRPEPWVGPDDRDAVFVEVVPRVKWGSMFADKAGDSGFLRVDSTRQLLLFEGVRQRYRIADDAISYCAVEAFDTALGQFSHFAVVLRACPPGPPGPEGEPDLQWTHWEAPLVPRLPRLFAGKKARRKAADELCNRIRQLLPLSLDAQHFV